MIQLNEYLINRTTKKIQYKYFPEDKGELKATIEQRIEDEGPECNLNDISHEEVSVSYKCFTYIPIPTGV